MTITADMEHLWHSHHAGIMRYVKHRLNDDVAEDLTQEVYLKAWEALCSGNGYSEHASGWLYRIAHNLVIDTYRARDRGFKEVHLDAIFVDDDGDHKSNKERGEVMLIEDESLEEQVERTLLLEEIGKAVGTLKKEQQEVIRLALLGYEYADMAERLGKGHDAAKAQYRRAIVNLRIRFGAAPVSDARTPITLTPKKKYAPRRPSQRVTTATRTRDLLRERGPMLASDIAELLDIPPKYVYKVLGSKEVFVHVGSGDKRGREGALWGLQGIHDTQEAA